MAYTGVDAVTGLRSIRSRNDAIRNEFLVRNRLLNQIRADVFLSGTYMRDYLLEPDAGAADAHKASLNTDRNEIEAALAGYGQRLSQSEAESYAVLTRELHYYWRVLEPALGWNAAERRSSGYAFLRDEVQPRRMAMVSLADQIARINEQQLNNGNLQVEELFARFRFRLAATVAATLGLGLALAALSMVKILRLEHATEEANRGLKDLSARLVQAQENERRAISRELHDEVGQSLSALLVGLSNLSAAIPPSAAAELESNITGIRDLAQNCVRVIRNMALLLRPSMLDDLGLAPALEWQARETSRTYGIRVDIAAQGVSDHLPEDHKTCVYRIVQEALHNCVRHSGASTVRVTVRQDAETVHVLIQDDGKGFRPASEKGLGLVGMEERVTHLGGSLRIDSHADRGTLLAITLPLTSANHEHDKNPVG